MEKDELKREEKLVSDKTKYYTITEKGSEVLEEARAKAYELFKEIKD